VNKAQTLKQHRIPRKTNDVLKLEIC